MLSSIPILNILNCCFCLLNAGGSALAVSIYLKENPSEHLSSADAALCGAMAGAISGLITGLLGLVLSMALGTLLVGLYASLPPQIAQNLAVSGVTAIVRVPGYVIAHSAFGALAGFLSMQLFHKDRLAG